MTNALQETLGLIRATNLFVQNYKEGAPPVTNDTHAMQCAAMLVEEALIRCLRETIEEGYPASHREKQRLIETELERLASQEPFHGGPSRTGIRASLAERAFL